MNNPTGLAGGRDQRKSEEKYIRTAYWRRAGIQITFEEFIYLKRKQKGVCAICGCPETKVHSHKKGKLRELAVDHNHVTGTVRGLLCGKCNSALGFFKDDIEILKKAVKYLEYWRETP